MECGLLIFCLKQVDLLNGGGCFPANVYWLNLWTDTRRVHNVLLLPDRNNLAGLRGTLFPREAQLSSSLSCWRWRFVLAREVRIIRLPRSRQPAYRFVWLLKAAEQRCADRSAYGIGSAITSVTETHLKEGTKLSCRKEAARRSTSLEIFLHHLRSFEITPLNRACVSSC